MNVIKIENLYKSFNSKPILSDLNLEVMKGSIVGFVGENGAGKTTTMKIILGLLKADGGTISIYDEKVVYGSSKTNKKIGYLPDVPVFYNYMNNVEYLSLCGEVSNFPKKELCNRVNEVLELVGLEITKKKIGNYSRGMKQRLGLAQALLNNPEILICDEPTSALDPIGRREFLNILSSIKNETTILFSSHILSDVEQVCDYVAILHSGTIKLFGEIDDLKERYSEYKYYLSFSNEKEKKLIEENLVIEKMNFAEYDEGIIIPASKSEDIKSKILDVLWKNKVLPVELNFIEPSLEDIFMEVVK